MKANDPINVQMVTPEGTTPTRIYTQEIKSFSRLGKEIRISPKANISVNKPGFKTEFFVESVDVLIGIGKDHAADLIMSKDSWEALLAGAEVSITTTEEFKRKYVYKIRNK